MDKDSSCYFLTGIVGEDVQTYSLREEGSDTPRVLLFQERDDAERYAIMLEEDADYIVGESFELKVTEIPLGDAIDIFNEKGHGYVFIKSDDLFVPPDTDFYPPPAADY